ncbi:hypothetical protein Tco_0804520 [Tanacetum coccineum]|uniref:Uncharacterized protein n=1 Tax=Tanacetum coccineum TaxID=301880 RepID=A0ABQ5A8F2_9ASTR
MNYYRPPPVQLAVLDLQRVLASLICTTKKSAYIEINSLSQVPAAVDKYLGSSLGDALQKTKEEQAEKQQMPKYSVKSSDEVALDEYDQKSALFQTMTESKSFNKHPTHKALYHALMESLLVDEEGMDQGVVDLLKQKKR